MIAKEIHKKYYPTISDADFNLIVSADELTSNLKKVNWASMPKWLLRLFVRKRLKQEDLYKAKEYIVVFDKLSKSNKLPVKDINKYQSLPTMYAVVKPYLQRPAMSRAEQMRIIKQNEVEKLYEDETFTVIYPKTRAASCLYGNNTEWCTAARKHNKFWYYNQLGKLYIIINKLNGKKYQFHFETSSFMDENDESLSKFELEAMNKIPVTENLKAFFINERQDIILMDKYYDVRNIFRRYQIPCSIGLHTVYTLLYKESVMA